MNSREKASTFLMQATLGANQEIINQVDNIGIENWLNNQLDNKPESDDSFFKTVKKIWRGKAGTGGYKRIGRKRPSFKRALIDSHTSPFYPVLSIGLAHIYE